MQGNETVTAGTGLNTDGGVGDYALVAHNDNLLTSDVTVCAWFKAPILATRTFILKLEQVDPSRVFWGLDCYNKFDEGQPTFEIYLYFNGSGTAAIRPSTVYDIGINVWHHVAFVWNHVATSLHLYIDGTLQDGSLGGTVPSSIPHNEYALELGADTTGGMTNTLDDIRVYGAALTGLQIEQVYNATPH